MKILKLIAAIALVGYGSSALAMGGTGIPQQEEIERQTEYEERIANKKRPYRVSSGPEYSYQQEEEWANERENRQQSNDQAASDAQFRQPYIAQTEKNIDEVITLVKKSSFFTRGILQQAQDKLLIVLQNIKTLPGCSVNSPSVQRAIQAVGAIQDFIDKGDKKNALDDLDRLKIKVRQCK